MPSTLKQVVDRVKVAKTDIAEAITAKGGTVASGDGLEEFAADIATIPSGGGGVSDVYSLSTQASVTNNQMFITKAPYTYSGRQYYTTMVFGSFYLSSSVSSVSFYYPKAFEDDNVTPLFNSSYKRGLYYNSNGYQYLTQPTIDLDNRKITISFDRERSGEVTLLAKWGS